MPDDSHFNATSHTLFCCLRAAALPEPVPEASTGQVTAGAGECQYFTVSFHLQFPIYAAFQRYRSPPLDFSAAKYHQFRGEYSFRLLRHRNTARHTLRLSRRSIASMPSRFGRLPHTIPRSVRDVDVSFTRWRGEHRHLLIRLRMI